MRTAVTPAVWWCWSDWKLLYAFGESACCICVADTLSQFSSVPQSCLTLCDPMDCSMPGFPVHNQLPELTHSCPSSQWCHPTISSSVIPFSSCLQSFPPSGSFPMSRFFASGGQSIGASASASVLLTNIQDWVPLGLTGWISFQSKGLSRVFSNTTSSKASILWCSALFIAQLSHPYMTTGKTIALTRRTFVSKVMSVLFNMLSRLVITFLPRSKRLSISWLQSQSAVILDPPKINSDSVSKKNYDPVSIVSPSMCHGVMGLDAVRDLRFLNVRVLSQLFHSPLSLSLRGSLVLLCFLP